MKPVSLVINYFLEVKCRDERELVTATQIALHTRIQLSRVMRILQGLRDQRLLSIYQDDGVSVYGLLKIKDWR